ncbi:DUF5330 domain-containing protein [Allorhizobium taibaishanense]|uniref:DUF5330 domain-containing protein n=1 Tax=Allorhizobium taibaishanense TaxID=887144 RepID=A0A1Q8ZZL4_9HYPH|nr:DUF5330 domain-containing protein [Allorhizobium taibaishanense]MBB4007275.1 hypothetical protein [Allorhizobium taibaishanense]OLP47731.1 hypothetical protein BJF91_04975 [Allorhizobium taibaishanense]
MWFLIKGTFWFTLVLVVLSYFGGSSQGTGAGKPQFELANAVSAASGAYDYLSGLCGQKPEVCVKGAETFQAIGVRAREGALVAYQLLNRQFGGDGNRDGKGEALRPGASVGGDATVSEAADALPARAVVAEDKRGDDKIVTGTVTSASGHATSGTGVPLTITVPRPRPKPAG